MNRRLLLPFLLTVLGVLAACSKPPVFRLTVPASHVASVEQRLMVRALEYQSEQKAATKEFKLESARARLRQVDFEQAKAWLRAAEIQFERAKLAGSLKKDVLDGDETKTLKEATSEVELAKLHLKYRELLYDSHTFLLDLYTWKSRSFRARYYEELVGIFHKTESSYASSYSKVDFADQTHRIRRRFLLLEERYEKLTKQLKTLRKRIGELWAPNFRRQPPPPCAPCKACAPCPSTAASRGDATDAKDQDGADEKEPADTGKEPADTGKEPADTVKDTSKETTPQKTTPEAPAKTAPATTAPKKSDTPNPTKK